MKIILILIIGNALSLKKLADNRRKGVKILTKPGWFFATISLLYIVVSALQYLIIDINSKSEQNERDGKLSASYESPMKKLKRANDSSALELKTQSTQIINSTNELLLAYKTISKLQQEQNQELRGKEKLETQSNLNRLKK